MNVSEAMFALFRSEFFGTELSATEKEGISPSMFPEIYKLSKRYDMTNLVAGALEKNDFLPEETKVHDFFMEELHFSVMRYEQIQYEHERTCQLLEAEKIPFIPLKGAVLRAYYPEPWMRTSCDIDVLVHEEDLERAVQALESELSYEQTMSTKHDVSLYAKSGVHLELHHRLLEDTETLQGKKVNEVLTKIWEYTKPCDGKTYQTELLDEFFYFYHIAHMAKHFICGGCGVRPFLDLQVLRKLPHDKEKRKALLEEGGLALFAEQSEKLSDVWFLGKEPDELSESMAEYILGAGMYGDFENRVVIQKKKKGGKGKYVLGRIFLSNSELKRRYPKVAKSPWKAPFYQVRRWFNPIFGKESKKRSMQELKTISDKNEKQDKVYALMRDLGF